MDAFWKQQSQLQLDYVYLQQDGVSPHRTVYTQKHLKALDIWGYFIDWPPSSPDCSPHQQKAILRQMRWCCVLTLIVWTLRPVRPVRRLVRRHIWLRLVRLDTLLSTGFRLDTCN